MSSAAIVEAAVGDRVLVVGSPPPGGRDLDLLVRPAEEHAAAGALAGAGYVGQGVTWARFSGGRADVVDLIPAAEWRLPDADSVFAEGAPLPGHEWLVVPAPHHEILIAAARFLGPGGLLPKNRGGRVRAGMAADPAAMGRARSLAPAWGVEEELGRLESALAGRPRRDLPRTVRATVRSLRPRGAVVALSGIDGSGRSTQARALADALESLGHDAIVVAAPPVEGARLPALTGGARHARLALPHLAAGRVVIFDGYDLDSDVRLCLLFGSGRRSGPQRLLVRILPPRPAAAFHSERGRAGVIAVDGGRDPDDIAAEIAETVWRRLGAS